jgi:hypothetical protein
LFLENFQLDTATLVYAINSFEYLYDYINNPFKFNELIQSNLPYEKSFSFYSKNQINAFIKAVHYRLSNLFENIVRTHFPQKLKLSFLENLATIKRYVYLDDYYYYSCKLFTLFRNSNHNNGLNRNKDFKSILRDGQVISLITNQAITIPMNSLAILIEDILRTLEVIYSSNVIDWKIYIKDNFAYQFKILTIN